MLYLDPIFRSPSNHRYDTSDHRAIDPALGTLADFQALVAAAHAHGTKLILDGVFNHTSSDSRTFDLHGRFDAAGNLTSPGGPGANDGSGGCEAGSPPFHGWYYFPDIGNPAGGGVDRCPNGPASALQTCEAWYGYGSLPKLRTGAAPVRDLFFAGGASSVGPYWTLQGADGWRFDVGGDVDPGLTSSPSNTFWESFRAAVRDAGVTGKDDTLLLGEEWGDVSAWLLGNEWDSVMSYRFRPAVLSWLFTGCSGNGCTGGTQLADNDSDPSSASGPSAYLSPSQLNARLRSIEEDYPPMAWKAMMNLAGSHDTNRIRFLLKKANNDSAAAAVQRMKELWLLSFTCAGAPTLYSGDEVGLSHDGVFSSGEWKDDPYTRAPYPWPDATGSSYVPDTAKLLAHARTMAPLRHSNRPLRDGGVRHGLVIDDASKVHGFARTDGTATALVAVAVSSSWGVFLLEDLEIDTPAAATGVSALAAGADLDVSWSPVVTDTLGGRELVTRYELHRSSSPLVTPGPATLAATVTPAPFGTADGRVPHTLPGAAGTTGTFLVRAFDAAGKYSDTARTTTPVTLETFVVEQGSAPALPAAGPGLVRP